MIKFIFVLYCVVGCEQTLPNHRMIYAYDTIEQCQKAKERVERLSTIYSCEKVSFTRY